MREKRGALAVFVCLFFVSISALAQTADFSISPSQFYVFDVENFIALRGITLGTSSTAVIYSKGDTRIEVPAQVDFDHLGAVTESWVPVAVAISSGDWSVQVVATDTDATQRTYGPVTLSIVERSLDSGLPVIPLPEVLVVEADDASGGIGNYDDGGASCNFPSGSHFPMGSTTVSCTAANSFGTSTQSFLVYVTDTVRPEITVPSDITTSDHVVSFTATATDNIDGTITPHCSPASGSTFSDGETIVQCVATDAHGNEAIGSFKVHINFVPPPVLNLPGNFNAEATGAGGATVAWIATASDGSGSLPVACSPASGSLFGFGVTEVDCSTTGAGGTVDGSFFVTVVDSTPPHLTLPANITVEATGASGAVVTYSASASDVVDGSVSISCSPASGFTFPLGTTTVSCTASDSRSNVAHGSFTVTVGDTTPPSMTLPADITKEATGPSGAVVTFTATAVDTVDGVVPVICSPASGSTFALGTTIVQCSATDAHLNKSSGSFLVKVQDTTPPVITSVDASPREIIWPPNHKLIPIQVIVSATDLVDPAPHARIISVSSDQPEDCHCGDGDVAPDWNITGDLTVEIRAERTAGVDRHYTVTVEVTDFSGNASRSTVVIAVHP